MIECKGLNKSFKVAKRNAGLREAVKALFKKEYTYVHALRDVSFTVRDGEMIGYIGPNGAGKSSTIKIMSGILTPDSGECLINGRIPWKDRIAHVREIGVVFGQRSQLWWDVPVIDSFELIRDIYKVPPDTYTKTFKQLTELLDISEIVRTPARQLSLGQRMRCEIAASLLHDPSILFLDEPTNHLDIKYQLQLMDIVRSLRLTVVSAIHDLNIAAMYCNKLFVLQNGRIIAFGPPKQVLTREFIRQVYEVEAKLYTDPETGQMHILYESAG